MIVKSQELNLECENSSGSDQEDKIQQIQDVPQQHQDLQEQEHVQEENDDDSNDSPNLRFPFPKRMFDVSLIPEDTENMKRFLTTPLPKGQLFQCQILRAKSGLARIYPIYHMYSTNGQKYLLSAKKAALNTKSNYIISMKKDHYSTKSQFYLGKLRSNFMGTEFTLFDNGLKPKNTKDFTQIRNELGLIFYESNLMSNKGPRKMKILLPKLGENGIAKSFMPLHDKEGMKYDYRQGKIEFIEELINKPPKWNNQIQAYVLNFYGRVEKPSVKNFQLVKPTQILGQIYLQFGRVSDERFNVDFTWPLSPLQVIQICASSFDFKFACE